VVTAEAKTHFRRALPARECRLRGHLKGANLQSCRDDIDRHRPPAHPARRWGVGPIQVMVFIPKVSLGVPTAFLGDRHALANSAKALSVLAWCRIRQRGRP
jgi:hypothetical protein